MIILPRQARDKHRENSKKKYVFLRVFVSAAAIEVAGVVAYSLLGQGDRQWWDLPPT